MLNPVECFIEVLQLQQEYAILVTEVQQFLDFDCDKVMQQDQKRIVNNPTKLIDWFNQIEDCLGMKVDLADDLILPIVRVQVLLINKFIRLSSQNLLSEYFYLFEILQKKILYLNMYSSDDLVQAGLQASQIYEETIDQNKLSNVAILLYLINQCDSTEKLDQLYSYLQKLDNKKHKLIEQQSNLVIYAYYQILQFCCQLVEQNERLDRVIDICLDIRDEFKKTNQQCFLQCNQCVLLAYYKMERIQEFLSFSKCSDVVKTTPIEIQILILIVKIKQLLHEPDFDKVKIYISKFMQQFMDNNLIHSVMDIHIILKELTCHANYYTMALQVLTSWFQFKYSLILKTSNSTNIQKMIKDINQMLNECNQFLAINFQKEELEYQNNVILGSLIELTEMIITISSNISKVSQIEIDEYLIFLLSTLPNFASDQSLEKQFGKFITIISQAKQSPGLQHLAMYLNIQFGKLPQAQTVLFQGLLKNYQSGFTTAILLFVKEFTSNQIQENRSNLSRQLKSLLEESYQLFDKNQVPFYCLLEACNRHEQNYFAEIVTNFFIEHKPILNQLLFYFLLDFINKCHKSNCSLNHDQLYQMLNQYISQKNPLSNDLLKYSYEVSNSQPLSLPKCLLKLYSFFMLIVDIQTCNILFIKETVLGNNQHKYKWKIDNNKSLFIMVTDVIENVSKESTFELHNLKHLFELLFYLIDQNTREEVNQVTPYILRQIIKVAYQHKLDEAVFKILIQSLKFDNLFLLLLLELISYGENRVQIILKRFIYEQHIPLGAYLLVICQIVEMSDTLDSILEMIPQLNQILRTTTVDEQLRPYTQLLFLKLTALKEYVPISKMDMICQSINLLSI